MLVFFARKMWNKTHWKEMVVYGDGNCFYRAISLWNDRTTDQNHGRVRTLINRVLESFPSKFEPFLFQVSSIPLHLAKSKRSGTWAETFDIVACATLFQRSVFVYSVSQNKWNRFPAVVKLQPTCPLVVQSKSCQCPITLVLHDENPATSHFNLLSPIVNCCTTPLPSNVFVQPNSSAKQPNTSTKQSQQPSRKQPNASTKQSQQPSGKQPNASTKQSQQPSRKQPNASTKQSQQPSRKQPNASTKQSHQPSGKQPNASTKQSHQPSGKQPNASTKQSQQPSGKQPNASTKQSHQPSGKQPNASTKQSQQPSGKQPNASTKQSQQPSRKQPNASTKQSHQPSGKQPNASTKQSHQPSGKQPNASTKQSQQPSGKQPNASTKQSHQPSGKQPNASTKQSQQPSGKQPNASTKQSQQPSGKQPNASAKHLPNQDNNQSSSFESPHENNESTWEKFEKMNMKGLKLYIQSRGITVSGYNKPDPIILAKAIFDMKLDSDPNFEKDSLSQCLNNRLTLPAGKVVVDPFAVKLLNDFSKLPPFGLMDIFNHLILSNDEYDKEKLASFRSFNEYTLFQDGYVRSLGTKTIEDNDGTMFYVVVGEVIPTQKEQTQEGTKHYKLWFILSPNGSVYSAFCRCKGGADQGCRHVGAALFELDDFLANNRISCTSLPAYWNPKPTPNHKLIPFKQMKISHSRPKKGKRKVTPNDESWVDSFDPRPKKSRNDTPLSVKEAFAQQLREIDPEAAILKFLPCTTEEKNDPGCNFTNAPISEISELGREEGSLKEKEVKNTCAKSILLKAEAFVAKKNICVENVQGQAKAFCEQLSITKEERDTINNCTIGQRENKKWREMRHLMVTGTNIKQIYTRQKHWKKAQKLMYPLL